MSTVSPSLRIDRSVQYLGSAGRAGSWTAWKEDLSMESAPDVSPCSCCRGARAFSTCAAQHLSRTSSACPGLHKLGRHCL